MSSAKSSKDSSKRQFGKFNSFRIVYDILTVKYCLRICFSVLKKNVCHSCSFFPKMFWLSYFLNSRFKNLILGYFILKSWRKIWRFKCAREVLLLLDLLRNIARVKIKTDLFYFCCWNNSICFKGNPVDLVRKRVYSEIGEKLNPKDPSQFSAIFNLIIHRLLFARKLIQFWFCWAIFG